MYLQVTFQPNLREKGPVNRVESNHITVPVNDDVKRLKGDELEDAVFNEIQ